MKLKLIGSIVLGLLVTGLLVGGVYAFSASQTYPGPTIQIDSNTVNTPVTFVAADYPGADSPSIIDTRRVSHRRSSNLTGFSYFVVLSRLHRIAYSCKWGKVRSFWRLSQVYNRRVGSRMDRTIQKR